MTTLRLGFIFVLLAAVPLGLWAQVSLPDTPAAQRFGEWLKVFNDGDAAHVQQYFEKNFPARAKMADQTISMRQQLGGLELQKLEETKDSEISCMVKSRKSGRLVRVTLQVETEAPHRIAAIRLSPAGASESQPAPARMSETGAIEALRPEIEKRVQADTFSGAVLIARSGKPIFAEAYGLADRERKIPNTADTRFGLASMNKMFTGVAIAQLAQAGKLKFSDPLVKFLPNYPNRSVAAKVTIEHLLTHTGGTGDFFGSEYEAHREQLRELKDYVPLFGKRELEFEPGSKWEYSNYGFVLLGLVVEAASGQSYYDYVRDRIYKPAGMMATDTPPEGKPLPNGSIGYTKGEGTVWSPNTGMLPPRGTSAGGGYSTVGDLLRFANALMEHKLLDAHYTELVTTGHVNTVRGKYGFGFEDHTEGNARWFGHGGGALGINGYLRIYPESGYVVAVLANVDPPAAQQLAAFVGDRLPAK